MVAYAETASPAGAANPLCPSRCGIADAGDEAARNMKFEGRSSSRQTTSSQHKKNMEEAMVTGGSEAD
eukprot:1989800-Prorocentrum_lima.AAC.1